MVIKNLIDLHSINNCLTSRYIYLCQLASLTAAGATIYTHGLFLGCLKVANGFLLLLLKQNMLLNIYTQKVGATVTHKIMYRDAQPSKNLGRHNLPPGSIRVN